MERWCSRCVASGGQDGKRPGGRKRAARTVTGSESVRITDPSLAAALGVMAARLAAGLEFPGPPAGLSSRSSWANAGWQSVRKTSTDGRMEGSDRKQPSAFAVIVANGYGHAGMQDVGVIPIGILGP